MGIIKVISTSKIRNTTAIRKNRKENGNRDELFGSNPHSNADGFSRSMRFFFAIVELIMIRASDKIVANIEVKNITFIKNWSCWLEVNCTLYTINV